MYIHTRLLSGIFVYFLGFWSLIILPLSLKSICFIPQGLLNSLAYIWITVYPPHG